MLVQRSFIETLAAAGLTALMFLASFPLQSLGPFLAFWSPAAVIWTTCRHGIQAGVFALVLASSLVMPFLTPPAILSFAFGVAAMGWLLGILLIKGAGLLRAAALTAVSVMALSAGASILFLLAAGVDPATFLGYQMADIVREAENVLREISRDAPAQTSGDFSRLLASFRLMLPSILAVTIFIQASANGLITLHFLNRSDPSRWRLPEITSFSLPDRLIWVLITALALLWTPNASLRATALNVSILLLFFYLLQGLSISLHVLRQMQISRPLNMILIIIVLLQPYLLLIPLAAGLLDFKFDWRSRWRLDSQP